MSITPGDVVVALAGKEKNQIFIVLTCNEKFCFLVDGQRLKLSKPKKKSLKHVQKASKDKFDENQLSSGQEKTNAAIRKFLKERSLVCQRKM